MKSLRIVPVLVCIVSGVAGAQPTSMECLEGSMVYFPTDISLERITVDGDRIAVRGTGMQVWDVSNPDNPTIVATSSQGVGSAGFSMSYPLVVGTSAPPSGARIIDFSDPANPVSVPMIGSGVVQAAVSGDRLYTIEGSVLNVYDVSDPLSPQALGALSGISTPGNNWGRPILVEGTTLYLLGDMVRIVDASNPAAMAVVGSYAAAGPVGATKADDLLYVVTAGGEMLLLDVSDPTDPLLVSQVATPFPERVAVAGDTVFVSSTLRGVARFDVSDPQNPVVMSTVVGPDLLGFCHVVRAGGEIFAVSGGGVTRIDKDHPANADATIASERPDGVPFSARIGAHAYRDGLGFLCSTADGGHLYVIDATAGAMSVLGTLSLGSTPLDVAVVDDTAYVAVVGGEILVVDVSVPGSPSLVGAVAVPSPAGLDLQKFVVSGDTLFVGADDATIVGYDISDPLSPIQIKYLPGDPGTEMRDFDWNGSSGAILLTLLQPGYDPTILSELDLSPAAPTANERGITHVFGARAVNMVGDAALVIQAENTTDLYVPAMIASFDLSGAAPVLMGSERFGSLSQYDLDTVTFRDLTVGGDRAYVGYSGLSGNGVAAFDISDPTQPRLASATHGISAELRADSGTLFGVLGFNQIRAYDIGPCGGGCPADLAEPFGVLNIFDLQAYVGLYNSQDPSADLTDPIGVFNIFDIQEYINLYNQGCP